MKPCRKNHRALALLAAGELESERVRRLHAHLETCSGCAGYWREMRIVSKALQAAATEPNLEASGAFHSTVLQALRSREPAGGSNWFEQITSTERWGLAAAGLAVGLTILSAVFLKTPPAPLPITANKTVEKRGDSELAPTLSNYQMVASHSLEQFDELLTRQANRALPRAPVYTPSSGSAGNGWD